MIDDGTAWCQPADLSHEITAQGFAPEDEATGGQDTFRMGRVQKPPEVTRDDLQNLDLPPVHSGGHRIGVEAVLRRKQMERAPRAERPE